ncbi:homing endonuclease associated repeat-containing protein [Bacillus velezensis]
MVAHQKKREIRIAQTYVNRFGNYNKALEAAGLTPNKKTSKQ